MRLKELAKALAPEWLWSRLQSYRFMSEYRQELREYSPRTVRHFYGGTEMVLSLEDPTAERWYDSDWPTPSEIDLLAQYGLGPGSRVFDIGAHQCIVAMILAQRVGQDGHVVAVEANPHNARVAQENLRLNNIKNIDLIHAAVADRAGQITINELMNGRIDGSRRYGSQKVPALTLDGLAAQYGIPDFVIVDVEGFECHVLRGAKSLLGSRISWCIEVHSGCGLEESGSNVDEVFSFFDDRYERIIGTGPGGSVHLDFSPFESARRAENERFFLVAITRPENSVDRL